MQAFARQMVNGLWLTGFNARLLNGAALNQTGTRYIMRLNNEKAMRGKTFASFKCSCPNRKKTKLRAGSTLSLHYSLLQPTSG
jgi:hypothetical protein